MGRTTYLTRELTREQQGALERLVEAESLGDTGVLESEDLRLLKELLVCECRRVMVGRCPACEDDT